jgi:hypothetical protein
MGHDRIAHAGGRIASLKGPISTPGRQLVRVEPDCLVVRRSARVKCSDPAVGLWGSERIHSPSVPSRPIGPHFGGGYFRNDRHQRDNLRRRVLAHPTAAHGGQTGVDGIDRNERADFNRNRLPISGRSRLSISSECTIAARSPGSSARASRRCLGLGQAGWGGTIDGQRYRQRSGSRDCPR